MRATAEFRPVAAFRTDRMGPVRSSTARLTSPGSSSHDVRGIIPSFRKNLTLGSQVCQTGSRTRSTRTGSNVGVSQSVRIVITARTTALVGSSGGIDIVNDVRFERRRVERLTVLIPE
jgi:hypothetical protein